MGWVRADLDDLIETHCAENQIALPAVAADTTFLRRVYLDSIGRIPTLEEAHAFLDSKDPGKKDQLIDELLASEGYGKHWFHFWADLLRVTTDGDITRSGIVGSAYSNWVLDALDRNVPYDEFVRDLIGRQGNVWEPENAGAVGFYERDFGMPLDRFSGLMRIFAGTRMECAQCHNHPFDRWTQLDFYQMAAFGFEQRAGKYPAIYEDTSGATRSAVNTLTVRMRFATVLPRAYPLKLPHDYHYDDADPFQVIEPKTVFGEVVHPGGDEPGAATFAKWLTSPSNPRFTRVIVNRLWKELFGAALVPPPLDDLRDSTQAINPELEDALVKRMIELGYDQRAFLAWVMKSKAYQRRAQTAEVEPGEPVYFAAPYLRRLSAEQIWDSMVTLITEDAERPNFQKKIYQTLYLADLRNRAERLDGSPEAVSRWLASADGERFVSAKGKVPMPEAESAVQDFRDKQKRYFEELNRFQSKRGRSEQFVKWKALHYQLYRASELPSPAPRGHFLRTFGQSDRLQAGNANSAASIPQTLALLNGGLVESVLNPFSKYSRGVDGESDSDSQLDSIFLGILGRYPSEQERKAARPLMNSKDDRRILMSALLQTSEFLFVR